MSILQKSKRLKDITSLIVSDFNACDINAASGSAVTALTGRDGKDTANATVGTFTLLYDADGFKFIRTVDEQAVFWTHTSLIENNNETFIFCSRISNATYALGMSGDYINVGQSRFAYANYTVNSGTMLFTKPTVGTKQIITCVIDGTTMKVYVGFKLTATLNNPALSSLNTTKYIFRSQNNSTNENCDFYSITRIQEALTGDRLLQAIRIKAFENGIKV